MGDGRALRVSVVHSPGPRQVVELSLELDAGATVLAAIEASGLARKGDVAQARELRVGIWGRKAKLDQVLREGDRVEVYRPLLVDPKVARRERFSKQGARAAGLFAKRRAGGKPGY